MYRILSLASKIVSAGNTFITSKLKESNYGQLAPSHGDILAVLYQYKKVTMQDLAEKIGKTKPTVTVLVNKLEKLGFVKREKSTADSRITYIRLSAQGLAFKPTFTKISKELDKILFKNFTKEELAQLDAMLAKILKNTH